MVGRRVLAAAVGAWLSVFVAAPAFASGPRAGDASASAVQLQVSPLAVVPASAFSALTGALSNINSVDASKYLNSNLGDASAALDVTNVQGSLGDLNVYHNSSANSTPVVVNVKAVASALNLLSDELTALGLPNVPQTLLGTIQTLESQLPAALQPYLSAVNGLVQNGSLQLKSASASYAAPGSPQFVSYNVVDPIDTSSTPINIIQTKALAPYTAAANNGDGTASNAVEATSSLDSLSLLNGGLPIAISPAALATLNGLISTLETALQTNAPSAASAVTGVTGTVSSTLAGTLSTLAGTVGTTPVNSIVPASTTLSTVGTLLTDLLDLKAGLAALPTNIDLSNIVATSDVASDVKTTVTNGVVDSIATTKAADIKLLTINAPQLVQQLGVAQGSALAEIIGATATVEAKADGQTSHASGSGQFTDIKLLPGTPYAEDICWASTTGCSISLAHIAGCSGGVGSTCTVTAGPLQVVINTGVCQCVDSTNGGTADSASAAVSALEVKINYLGGLSNLLLGVNGANVANPLGSGPSLSAPATLADAQVASVSADAGQHATAVKSFAPTGSPYGTGLLIGFLLLIGALGMGVTYRRFAAVKAGR